MDINKYQDQPAKVCYELWGWDTFSREDYFVGLYTTNSSANRARRKLEEKVKKSQDEKLRDSFTVNRTTVGEHIEMVRQRREHILLTREMISKHKKIIDEVFDQFRKLVQDHGGEAGEHSMYLLSTHPDCEISKLTVENSSVYEWKRKGPVKFWMEVGIYFKMKWGGAPFRCSLRHMRCGTLEALARYTHEEMFFVIICEHFYKTIEKYFFGD